MEDSANNELSTPLLGEGQQVDIGHDVGDVENNANNNDDDIGGIDSGEDLFHDVLTDDHPDYESIATLRSSNKTSITDYESHFTLRIPTSTVHFRGSILRVIDTDQDQIILQQRVASPGDGAVDEEGGGGGGSKEENKILVKRLSPGTIGQRFLRVGYTLVTILFVGFLFVFCFQVLIFLFIALPVNSGYTSENPKVEPLSILSSLLSFPLMTYGMASLMAMGSAFVVDTYNGAALFRSTIVEVLYMMVFLIVPIFTFIVNLFMREDEPWRRAASVWVVMVAVTFTVWACAVTYKEVMTCFWLVNKHFPSDDESFEDFHIKTDEEDREESQDSRVMKEVKKLLKIAYRAVLLTQRARYSGELKQRFNIKASARMVSSTATAGLEAQETKMGLYTRLTSVACCSKNLHMFDKLDPPKRVYSSEEVRDILPFMTKNNWSMSKMWCAGSSRHHQVIVARGQSAITSDQAKCSFICTIASAVIMLLLLLSCMAWMETGAGSYILVLILLSLCCIYPVSMNALEMYRMYDGVNDDDDESVTEEEANLFQVWETFRVTQPKPWYCYTRIILEVIFLFLWPFTSMLVERNYPVAFVFFLLSILTLVWRYFDASAILSELGSMSDVADDTITHQQKYRMNEIVGRIIGNKGRKLWYWVFCVFFLAIMILFIGTNNSTDSIQPQERGTRPPILLPDPTQFYYEPEEGTLSYPNCKLSKGFEFPGDGAADIGDYSYLSAMAYETSNVNNYTLAKWFGPDMVVDENEFVAQYRKDSGTATNPVYFKLFSFPNEPGYAIMSIRGSETAMDWLANMQLWSAAGLAQVVKWFTPFGWIWEPVLPHLIYMVSKVESKAISAVSYYQVTTNFVNDVLENGYGGEKYSNLHVTGVSLGGGLAIITGAQTNAFTVAISGPGATLSREAFKPPIQLEKLNKQTFNWIPERDFIARLGGRAPFFQNAECTAPMNDLFGCHSLWRSVCEIHYRCGSNGRPVPCVCITSYGYPEPSFTGNTTSFGEACQAEEEVWYEMFPPPK